MFKWVRDKIPTITGKRHLLYQDVGIFTIMAVLAACGLIYEYLLSHYAGRVLGVVEVAIFAMIGIMIVSMGVGAFLSRFINDPFTGFAWLELGIACLGCTSVLIIASFIAFVEVFPYVIAENYGMPPDLVPRGGGILTLGTFSKSAPYAIGFVLGAMIGAEIPLIARVRQSYYEKHLIHNTGAIYGIDYIGAGIGAAIWVLLMLSMDISLAAALTATANILVGLLFYFMFRSRIRFKEVLLFLHIIAACLILTVATSGKAWEAHLEDLLYKDKVVFRMNTKYQHITITERRMDPAKPTILTFYINGRTQFSSNDEHIYHAMLTYPAMAGSARHDNILIIGGGDGLALRDVLRWKPKKVLLLDLDKRVIELFSMPVSENTAHGNFPKPRLIQLNNNAFSDPRVEVHIGDAFITVDELLNKGALFDTIIVDLPDPSHPDLNKLYSSRFYTKLLHLLSGDGVLSVQSTSPYHAKQAFLCIGKTVRHAGFGYVEFYHHNVPSFGEWGWTIATKNGKSAKRRLQDIKTLLVDDGWTTKGKMLAAFEFSKHYFDDLNDIMINRLGSGIAYQYHYKNWQQTQGIYISDNEKM